MTNVYIQKNNPGNNMQQQLLPVVSPSGMNASSVGNMQTNIFINTNGTVSPQGNCFPNDIVSQTRGPPQASTSQWQTTQQVSSHQYVMANGFANARQPMNLQHTSTEVLGTYPVNQEYNISSNKGALAWTKEANYTTQAAQECMTSVMSHAKNAQLNPQQTMSVENMQNPTCFTNGQGNDAGAPNQNSLVQSTSLPQQYVRSKAVLEGKNVWPPKFDSRLPMQPVQCQQSMHLQPHHGQNQYGTQIQQPFESQLVQRQQSVHSQQPEQWQQQLLMQQPMYIHKPVHQHQFVQPQNSVQHQQRVDQQQPLQNQQVAQRQKQQLQQVLQHMQQPVQHQQFSHNQPSVQLQQQIQTGQVQQPLQCLQSMEQQRPVQHQQQVQLQHQMQHQQPVHQHQSVSFQQLKQLLQFPQVQHPQPVGYNNENMQNQMFFSERQGENYVGGHQPPNITVEKMSQTAVEKTSLTGSGCLLSAIPPVGTPLDNPLRQSNTVSSFEQLFKINSQQSHQTEPGTFQRPCPNTQQFTIPGYNVQEQSLQVPDKTQMQGTSPAYGLVQAVDPVKESGVAPANPITLLGESDIDVAGKELQQMYVQILQTKYHFLHLVRKFKEKRGAYQSFKNRQSQNLLSSKHLTIKQNANGTTVPTDGTQLPKNLLCNQNLIMQNTKAINDTVQPAIISNDHMHNLDGMQQVNTSPTLPSPPLSHLHNDAANLTNKTINYPEGQYLQVAAHNYSTVINPQKDKADPDFQHVNVLSVTQEKATVSPKQTPDQLTLASQQSAGASDLQSKAQDGKLPDPSKSTDARKTPILLDLLMAPDEKSVPHLDDMNIAATSSNSNLPSCNTKALTVNKINNLTDSSLEEASDIPAELEMTFSQMSSATLEALESCFGLWKTTPSNIAVQAEPGPNPHADPASSPGLCDQNGTVGQDISAQSSLASKTVAVVNPLVLSMSECPNNAAASKSQTIEIDRVRQAGTSGLLLEQNIQSTMVDSSSMPDIGVNAIGNLILPTDSSNMPDKLDMSRSLVCTNHSEVASVVSSSSYDSSHQSKPDQSVEVVEKAKQSNPLDRSDAVGPQSNVSCQLGSTLDSPDVKVRNSAGTLKGVLNEQLLISSICTLVEGNTLYDSQIAKIFDDDSLAEGDCSKNLPEQSDVQPTVNPLGFSNLAQETELMPDVQNSKGLPEDFDKQHGDTSTSQTMAVTLTESLNNINPSDPTPDNNKVLVLGTKHKYGRKQIHNKFQTISPNSKKSEFRHSSYEKDGNSVSKEKGTEETVVVTNEQIEEEDQLIKGLAGGASYREVKVSEALVHFKADQISKNDNEDDNLFETLTKQSNNGTSSIKETDVEQAATSADNPIIEDNTTNAEAQLEKGVNATLREVQSHDEGTLFTDYHTRNANESAGEVASAQGLHDQLSELLLEFPFGLDRREHVLSLEGQGVVNKDSPKCNSVKQDLQVEKEFKCPARNSDPETESYVNGGREKSIVAAQNWTDESCTISSADVHGSEQKAINQSIEKCDTAHQQSVLQLATPCSDSSQIIPGENKADSLTCGSLKIDIKKEKEESEVFSCGEAELQLPKQCSFSGGFQDSRMLNSVCRNSEKNSCTALNSINKHDTPSPLQSREPRSEADSLNIGSVKIEIKIEKQEEPEFHDCVKQETLHKDCSRSGMYCSINQGLERSDCTTQSMVDKSRSTSPEAQRSAAESSLKESLAKYNTAEHKFQLSKNSKCPFKKPSNAAGASFPSKHPVKDEIKTEKQESEVSDSVKQGIKQCSVSLGINVTEFHNSVNQSVEKRDGTAQKRVDNNEKNFSGSSPNVSSGNEAESLNKDDEKKAIVEEGSEVQKCVKGDSQSSEERRLAFRIEGPNDQLSVNQSLEKIHGSESIDRGLLKCNTVEQKSKIQLRNTCSPSASIPDAQKLEYPDKGSAALVIVGKMVVGEIHNSTQLSDPEKENSVCQEQEESCLPELKIECNLNEKGNMSSTLNHSSANAIVVGADENCPVVLQESQLDDKFMISFPNIDDSQNDCSLNQIKITVLDFENTNKLFPPTPIGPTSEGQTSDIQNGAQLSAEAIIHDIPTHHKLEEHDSNQSGSVGKEHTPSNTKTCCLYKWLYSLYSYGPKCRCIHCAGEGTQTYESYSKGPNCKEADTAVNSPCTMDDSLKENVHCRKPSKEINKLSLKAKGIKRPKTPALVSDCKQMKTVAHVTSSTAPPTLVEHKPSEHTHSGKSDLCKKKSEHEKQSKQKLENESKEGQLKTQPVGIAIAGDSQIISVMKNKTCLKVPSKNILPDKKSSAPEMGQNSSNKQLLATKTEHGKREEWNKEKNDPMPILKSDLKKSKNKLKKLKSLASSGDHKSHKAKELSHRSICADGSKRHSEKSEKKKKHKRHEKKSKVSTGSSCSREEKKPPNTEVKTKVLAEKYASNQEIPAKKQIEADKSCAKKETLPRSVPLQDSDKKVLSDSENQGAAADKKRTLTIQEYQQRREAEHLKAVKRNLAVHEAREAMNVQRHSLPNHTHSHSKTERAKANGTPSKRPRAEDNTSKCAETIDRKKPVHDTTKGIPPDPARFKLYDSSSKVKPTKHDFAHSKSISSHGSVGQQVTKSSMKMAVHNKEGNEPNKASDAGKNPKESTPYHPEKAAVTSTTQQAMFPKNTNLGTSGGKEHWHEAFKPTLEKTEVSFSRNDLVDPRNEAFRPTLEKTDVSLSRNGLVEPRKEAFRPTLEKTEVSLSRNGLVDPRKEAFRPTLEKTHVSLSRNGLVDPRKEAFRPTLEKTEVSFSCNGLVDPRMLKFKLGPDVLLRRHSTDGGSLGGNRLASSEKCAVEGIKSKKEDWYNSSPKKRKLECNGLSPELTTPKQGASTEKPTTEKSAAKPQPNPGSKATFDAYKKRYLDIRSKSIDGATTK